MKAVMYGAGNIGRGFLGQIFSQSGYELTFIDVAEPVIDALNRDRRYPVRILFEGGSRDIWIEGVSAINGRNVEEAAEAIAGSDIMATAVGVRVLPFIAPVIAAGLKKRFTPAGDKEAPGTAPGGKLGPLNIIICENLIDANKVLEGLIKKELRPEEQKIVDTHTGLVEASIGRMVPLQTAEMQDGNPLRVCVEAYGFLPVDKAAFKGEIPSLAGLCPFDNFDLYIQRKLFIHNMGHAICAYFGMIRGDKYIYETVRRGSILCIAQNAMLESALALHAKYKASLPDLLYHIRDLLLRFSNSALGDTCARVGADTVRKLGNRDRLIGALLLCREEGITPAFVSAGAAAALYCHLKEKGLPEDAGNARAALAEVSGLGTDSAETERILSFYSVLAAARGEADFDSTVEKIIKNASVMGQKPGVI